MGSQMDSHPSVKVTDRGSPWDTGDPSETSENNVKESDNHRRDEHSNNENKSNQEISVSEKWGDREVNDQEQGEWIEAHPRKEKRNRFKAKQPEQSGKPPAKSFRKPMISYMDKLESKKAKAIQSNFVLPPPDSELHKYYEYATRSFPVMAFLRPPTEMETTILSYMKEGKISLPILPQFLRQIMSSKNISRLNAFLLKKHSAELYAQLAPGHNISVDLPSHAIMRNVCTAGEVPISIVENINSFKADVSDVYYLASKRILFFSFNSNEKAAFWNCKELPFQNKPLTLNYYYNGEAHQKLPPVYMDNISLLQGKSDAEKLVMVESIKTKIPYRFAIVNASSILKHHHIETLLVDTLHLQLGCLSQSINPLSKTRRKSTWDIELATEGCPDILKGKSSIQWGTHKIMIFHHTINTSLPCTKCYAFTHIYAKCKITDDKDKKNKNILRLRRDKDYVQPEPILMVDESEDDTWSAILDNSVNTEFLTKIRTEASLDEFQLSKDIDILYAHRIHLKKQLEKQKKQNKHQHIIKQTSFIGPLTQDDAEEAQYDGYVTNTVQNIFDFIGTSADPFHIYTIIDDKLPTKNTIVPSWHIWTENNAMRMNDRNQLLMPEPQQPNPKLSTKEDNHSVKEVHMEIDQSVDPATPESPTPIIPDRTNCNKLPSSELPSTQIKPTTTSASPNPTDIATAQSTAEKFSNPTLNKTGVSDSPKSKITTTTSKRSKNKKKQEPEVPNAARLTSFFQKLGAKDTDKQNVTPVVAVRASADVSIISSKNDTAHLPQRASPVDRQTLISMAQMVDVLIPGKGHCLMIALLVGITRRALQDHTGTTLSAFETKQLNQFRKCVSKFIYDNKSILSLFTPQLADNNSNNRVRFNSIKQYIAKICETDATEVLQPQYYASSVFLDVVATMIKQPIYLVDDSTHPTSITKHSPLIIIPGDTPSTNIRPVPIVNWTTEIDESLNAGKYPLILSFVNQNHFQVSLLTQTGYDKWSDAWKQMGCQTPDSPYNTYIDQVATNKPTKRIGPSDILILSDTASSEEDVSSEDDEPAPVKQLNFDDNSTGHDRATAAPDSENTATNSIETQMEPTNQLPHQQHNNTNIEPQQQSDMPMSSDTLSGGIRDEDLLSGFSDLDERTAQLAIAKIRK